jgi:hypothetical protein
MSLALFPPLGKLGVGLALPLTEMTEPQFHRYARLAEPHRWKQLMDREWLQLPMVELKIQPHEYLAVLWLEVPMVCSAPPIFFAVHVPQRSVQAVFVVVETAAAVGLVESVFRRSLIPEDLREAPDLRQRANLPAFDRFPV